MSDSYRALLREGRRQDKTAADTRRLYRSRTRHGHVNKKGKKICLRRNLAYAADLLREKNIIY